MSVRLSIIVPVYNVKKYLRRCIESLSSQTFNDFELILVDDGSSDGSSIICDEYADKDSRIRVFHKKNGGVSTARNVGLDNACGEYVSFVDSDDWVEPNYAQMLMENVGDADIMFFDEIHRFDDGFTSYVSCGAFYSKNKKEIETKMLQMACESHHLGFGFGHGWNKTIRRAIITSNNIRFIEGLSYCEDRIFTMDCCNKIKTFKVLSPSHIYNYRMDVSTSLTHVHIPYKQWVILANAMEERFITFDNKDLQNYYINRVVQHSLDAFFNSKGMAERFSSIKMCIRNIHKYGLSKQNAKSIIGHWKKSMKGIIKRILRIKGK